MEDWDGIRVSITAYTVRGINAIGTEETRSTTSARFSFEGYSVRRCRRSPEGHLRQGDPTEAKEQREEGLWRSAIKASAMITMTMSAASSYISESFARPADDRVAILEIGGTEQTYYAAEIGALVSEPLDYD